MAAANNVYQRNVCVAADILAWRSENGMAVVAQPYVAAVTGVCHQRGVTR